MRQERRKSQRMFYFSQVSLVTKNSNEELKAITLNISDGGLCLYSYSPLEREVEVEVRSREPSLNKRTGVVRWVQRLTNEVYKVGLMYKPCTT